ncbi:hypothetical protein EVAR_43790_1 [Eumeta japonica]|uniref:Uncharacterized protein n=1 Tax=Eumeta variegata TaxID=151549 RepID=A0A4C1XY81_EUMVA|nr:hypothetical protein EVAR_43790_1 [Eumeta japonica]
MTEEVVSWPRGRAACLSCHERFRSAGERPSARADLFATRLANGMCCSGGRIPRRINDKNSYLMHDNI